LNNANNPQWWLKSHTFVITSTLNEYLKSHSIPEQEAEYLCYIQNKVIVGSDRAETDERGYLRVARRVWRDKCGMHYTRWIDLLIHIGELETDNSYHFLPPDASPEERENFIPKCKGFKVPFDKVGQGLVRIDFKKKQVNPLKSQTIEKDVLTTDPHIYHIWACLAEVRIVSEPTFPNDPLRYTMVKQYLEKTHYKAFGLHRAKVGRVFHSIIEMPKEGRVNLKHSSGESFVDVDIKTCHPHLLLPLFTDPKEREAFYHDLQTDVYKRINPEDDRDKVKRRVCQYLMAKNRNAEWLMNTDVHAYFTRNYPIFYKEKLSQDNGLAWHLQGAESQIVTRDLVAYCKANQYFIIPMHDGCLTLERYKWAIMNELKRLLREHTGYAVGVEEKPAYSQGADTCSHTFSGPEPLRPTAFDFASIDLAFEMETALNEFQRQYEPLQKQASREARHNHNPNVNKPDWREWRDIKGRIDTLIRKYQAPIRYFAEKKHITTKERIQI
jgi:hypothetical protein